MSAFLVNDHETAAIAFTLVKTEVEGFAHWNPAELACELRCLNLASLDARYGDAWEWGAEDTIPDQLEDGSLYLDADKLKDAIGTLTYQCGEGYITSTPPFRRLCELIGKDDIWHHDVALDWRAFPMFRAQPKKTEPETAPEPTPEPERPALPPKPVQYDLCLAFS